MKIDGRTKQQYVDDVCECIFHKGHTIPDEERPYIISCIEDCFDSGFSAWDAYCFTRRTEHVNPDLPEEVACRQMNKIAAKYRNAK